MPKRFRDTDIWKKKWYRSLSPELKCAWDYLCDNCDHAGIWDVDMETMSFLVGSELSVNHIMEAFKGRVILAAPDKILIAHFVEFQYGTLNKSNRVHNSVLQRLEKLGASKALVSPLQGAKDTDTDKDKDKDKDKEKDWGIYDAEVQGLLEAHSQKLSTLPGYTPKVLGEVIAMFHGQMFPGDIIRSGIDAFYLRWVDKPDGPPDFGNSLRRCIQVAKSESETAAHWSSKRPGYREIDWSFLPEEEDSAG